MVALDPLAAGAKAETRLVPLASVAGPDRAIPKEWIGGGNPPTNEGFANYLRPLIGELLQYEEIFQESEPYGNA
jgi:hypothetical protein